MIEPKRSTVYIDEAGDLGINTGTKWFVLSAVIVDNEDEQNIRARLSQIKSRLNVNEIHIRKIKEFNRRAYIVNQLRDEKFTYINIIADTRKLDKSLSSLTAYNYLCRFLLERVSWFLRDTNRFADLVLSSRGTSRDNELIEYIQSKLIPFPENEIIDRFLKLKAKSPSEWDLLQLADVCATTLFLSLEINAYGFCLPCFSRALASHLYSRNGNIIKYGIKYFDDNMKPKQKEFENQWICRK